MAISKQRDAEPRAPELIEARDASWVVNYLPGEVNLGTWKKTTRNQV
ncbi:MAG: hypothetical protein M1522_00265 [Actinobacteria bacterium]|nr:hypothetical protein [Actinomycetota bacterium]